MIALQRLNGASFIMNADLIETIESTPDTVITLQSGKKVVVRNSIEDVVRKAVKYKQLCNQSLQVVQSQRPEEQREN